VSLGLGSVIASAIEVAPWLPAFGRNKGTVFLIVGGLLALNYWLAVLRPQRQRQLCAPGDLCHVDSPSMKINRVVFWISVAIYGCAVAISYGLLWWAGVQS